MKHCMECGEPIEGQERDYMHPECWDRVHTESMEEAYDLRVWGHAEQEA